MGPDFYFLPGGPKVMDMWKISCILGDGLLPEEGQGTQAPTYSASLSEMDI